MIAVFQIMLFSLGLPLNVLLLVAIVKEHLYRQPTIILLMNLAISDLLVLITVIPVDITVGIAGEYILGRTDAQRCLACYLGLVDIFISVVSIYTVSMMSFDRFIFIYKPLRYSKLITPLRTVDGITDYHGDDICIFQGGK